MMSLTGRTAACGGWPSAGAPDDRRPAGAGSAFGRSLGLLGAGGIH